MTREWQGRVFFLNDRDEMIEVVYTSRNDRPSKRDLRQIVQQAAAHRFELYTQWQEVVDLKTADPKG